MIGGARLVTAREPTAHILSDEEDKLQEGIPEYYTSWPASGVVGWPEQGQADFAMPLNEGGCWSGGKKLFPQSRLSTGKQHGVYWTKERLVLTCIHSYVKQRR